MKFVLASLAMFVLASGVNANCSTGALAGKWTVMAKNSGTGGPCTVTIASGGTFTGCLAGTITMTTVCKWSATVGAIKYAGRSEAIPSASTLKPNLLIGASATDPVFAFRQ